MKLWIALLASVLVNLAGLWFLREQPRKSDSPGAITAAVPAPGRTGTGIRHQVTMVSDVELGRLRDDLVRAGYPPSVVRQTIVTLLARRANRQRSAWMYPPDAPFWRQGVRAHDDADRSAALHAIDLEYLESLRKVLGPAAVDTDSAGRQLEWERRLGRSIPREKFNQLLRLTDDYGLVQTRLASQRVEGQAEQIELAARELRAGIERLLTPDELREYDLRYSSRASRLASVFGSIEITEADFRILYGALADEEARGAMGTEPVSGEQDGVGFAAKARQVLGDDRYHEIQARLSRLQPAGVPGPGRR